MTTKYCSKCATDRPIEAFSLGTGLHGRTSYCRDCMSEYNRERRAEQGAKTGDVAFGRPFRPEELVVCPKCSLRGPHECIGSASTGIGRWSWV